jgi:hypothetical protein
LNLTPRTVITTHHFSVTFKWTQNAWGFVLDKSLQHNAM